MFASAGKSLHLNSLDKDEALILSKYDPKSNIKQITWCYNNSYIAILPEDGYPQIICTKNLENISLVHTITVVPDASAIKFKTNTKKILAIGTKSGKVILYNTKERCVALYLSRLPAEIAALEFHATLNKLAVIGCKKLYIFSLIDCKKIELKNPDICTALKIASNNAYIGCLNGMVIIWDIINKCKLKKYGLHYGEISGIALAKTEKFMVTAGMDHKLCIIDNLLQKCIFKKNLHQPITALDLNSNEQYMVVGLKDGTISVYNIGDHLKPRICTKMHSFAVNQISFINEFALESRESNSTLGERQDCDHCNQTKNKFISKYTNTMEIEISSDQDKEEEVSNENCYEKISSDEEISINENQKSEIDKNNLETIEDQEVEISEETLKSDLFKLMKYHFSRLDDRLVTHCKKLEALVCDELDSLYGIASRWECFKRTEKDEILQFVCSNSSRATLVSEKSDRRTLTSTSAFKN